MPLTQLEAELRPIARKRIATGQLPNTAPSTMWGGPGTGQPCALCQKTILPADMELEFEAPHDGSLRKLRFHVVCQSVWQLECARHDYLKKHPSTPDEAPG